MNMKSKGFTPLETNQFKSSIISKRHLKNRLRRVLPDLPPSRFSLANRSLTGFTLIELMLVVIILSVLAAMIIPRFTGRAEQARIAAAQSDLGSISLTLRAYEIDNGRFPTTEQGLKALVTKPSTSPTPNNWQGPYLEQEPLDPWKRPYQYKCPPTNHIDFDLWSLGQDEQSSEDDIVNWKK